MDSGFEIDLITFMIGEGLLLIEDVKDDIFFYFSYFLNISDEIYISFDVIVLVSIVNFQSLEGFISEHI